MPRMSKKRRLELSFFLNERNRVTYNELCRKCCHDCKQSFRAVVIECPKYLSKRSYFETAYDTACFVHSSYSRGIMEFDE